MPRTSRTRWIPVAVLCLLAACGAFAADAVDADREIVARFMALSAQYPDGESRVEHLDGLLDLAAPERRDLWKEILDASAMHFRSEYDEALPAFEAILKKHSREELGDLAYLLVARQSAYARGLGGDAERAEEAMNALVAEFKDRTDPMIESQVARVLRHKAALFSDEDEPEKAIAAYDEAIERYDGSADPEVREAVAQSKLGKGLILHGTGDKDGAGRLFDRIAADYRNDASLSTQRAVAVALFSRSVIYDQAGEADAARRTCDELARRFPDRSDPEVALYVSMGMFNKAVLLGQNGKAKLANEAYTELIEAFRDDPNPGVMEQVAMSMINKGMQLLDEAEKAAESRPGRVQDLKGLKPTDPEWARRVKEITARASAKPADRTDYLGEAGALFDQVIERYGERKEAELMGQVARAYLGRAAICRAGGDDAGELRNFEAIIDAYQAYPWTEVTELVALAMQKKGLALERAGDREAEIAAYSALIDRFADTDNAEIALRVAVAMNNKGTALRRIGDTAEAVSMHNAVLEKYKDAAEGDMATQVAFAGMQKGLALYRGGDSAAARAALSDTAETFKTSGEKEAKEIASRASRISDKIGRTPKTAYKADNAGRWLKFIPIAIVVVVLFKRRYSG